MKRTFPGNLQQPVQQLTHRSPAHMHKLTKESEVYGSSFSKGKRSMENEIILTQTTLFISLGSKQISGAPTQEGHIYAYCDRTVVRQHKWVIFMRITIDEPGAQLKCFLDLHDITKSWGGTKVSRMGKSVCTNGLTTQDCNITTIKSNNTSQHTEARME
uniref:Uncharacterized protein n=1 Tax=Glossina palpalis gambiensis TaxID=67801 RepID=A0A1B0AZV0_9MUSC